MGQDTGSRSFPVGTGHRKTKGIVGDRSQYFRTFPHRKAMFHKIIILRMIYRYCRRIDHQGRFWIQAGLGNQIYIVPIMDIDSQFGQLFGQRGTSLVITRHLLSDEMKISGKGGHTDTSNTDKIDAMYILYVHTSRSVPLPDVRFNNNFSISLTISFVASGKANFLILVPRSSRFSFVCIKSEKTLSNSLSRSLSLIRSDSPFATRALAFFVWWSSDTVGEGIKISDFPTIHNSETEPAPALEIITSAAL